MKVDIISAFDTITARCYELNGLAGIIDELAEKKILLTPEELDFLGTSVGRIADDIHNAMNIIYNEFRQKSEDAAAPNQHENKLTK